MESAVISPSGSSERIVTALDSDYFLACVDVGHSNMVNNGAACVAEISGLPAGISRVRILTTNRRTKSGSH